MISFVEVDLATLYASRNIGSYAGGSNHAALDDFKTYVQTKPSFGKCSPPQSATCYFCPVDNAEAAENILLKLNFPCNQQKASNLEPRSGYVYIIS